MHFRPTAFSSKDRGLGGLYRQVPALQPLVTAIDEGDLRCEGSALPGLPHRPRCWLSARPESTSSAHKNTEAAGQNIMVGTSKPLVIMNCPRGRSFSIMWRNRFQSGRVLSHISLLMRISLSLSNTNGAMSAASPADQVR